MRLEPTDITFHDCWDIRILKGIDGEKMHHERPLVDDRDLMRVLIERTKELEALRRQLIAARLEISVRLAYVAELEQRASSACARAEAAEFSLRALQQQNAEALATRVRFVDRERTAG